MEIAEIILEINKLSVTDRLFIARQLMNDLRNEQQLTVAADKLYNDYAFDNELTMFTCLDGEGFL